MGKNTKKDFDSEFIAQYEKFYKLVRNFIRKKFISDIFIVEDITHNVFLKIYEKKTYLDIDNPGVVKYLYIIARNMVFDYLSRQNRERQKMEEIHIEDVLLDKTFYRDVEDFYIEGEVLSTIQDTIDSFPEEEKELYIQKNFENINGSKIMKKEDVSRYIINRIERKVNEKIAKKLKDFDEGIYSDDLELKYKCSGLLCEPRGRYK